MYDVWAVWLLYDVWDVWAVWAVWPYIGVRPCVNAVWHVRREGGCEEVREDMVPQHHPSSPLGVGVGAAPPPHYIRGGERVVVGEKVVNESFANVYR